MFESTVAKAKVITDETGIAMEVPVLLTENGILIFLADYLIENLLFRSPSWMIRVVMAVRIFLEYLEIHVNYENELAVFENFRLRLLTGTISNGDDQSGLCWSARKPKDVARIIVNLTDFFNWWARKNPLRDNPINSWSGSQYDMRIAEAAYHYRRNQAFLGHTWSTTGGTSSSKTRTHNSPAVVATSPPSFPENKFIELLLYGFKVGKRYNFRDMLITLLLNGAGFRESEPFHLYLIDVIEDPLAKGSALVLIHHPSQGDAPYDPAWLDSNNRPKQGNRTSYLAERYGLSPRSWGLSTEASGWKGGAHESELGGYYKQAHWFLPEMGELFWNIWNIYMEQVARIDTSLRNHPYAFMNVMREPKGDMYKLGKFQSSHADAVRRIGLIPAKHLGTSDHGHRHAYGQRLRKAGVPGELITRLFNHTDLASKDVYTSPGRAECRAELASAIARLDANTDKLRSGLIEAKSHF